MKPDSIFPCTQKPSSDPCAKLCEFSIYLYTFLAYFPYLEMNKIRLMNSPFCPWTPKPNFMKLGMYIMAPEPISTAYFINPTYQFVCLYVYPLLAVRQLLGNLFTEPLPSSEYTQQQINCWEHHSLCYPCRIKGESVCLCIPLPYLGNGSVNTFPRQRRIIGRVVFYGVHVA
jgi:hypothetical protein